MVLRVFGIIIGLILGLPRALPFFDRFTNSTFSVFELAACSYEGY